MDTQNTSAPPRARSAPVGNPTRSRHHTGGVIHDNTRHTTRFVVIGNHLTQHPELSLLAIGLGCHIQSLPTGTPVDIKSPTLRPMVAGPHNMPVITDPEEARADLAGASLAAITHAAEPVVDAILKALSTALRDEPKDIASPLIEFTAQGLGKNPAKHLWRNLVAVDLSFYKSYLAEEVREEVRKEVREEVQREVREEVQREVRQEVREEVQREVREEARAEDRAEDILFVLEQRGLDVSDDVRSRITDCTDPDLLRHWLARAVTVPKAEEIFEGR
ncbi:hypothetical protein [Streptomyces sp. NPDC000931]|uniref:hypothetical protein n=1 Tax=Streptomyces sp. NPDC000931 TaxID=3154372 RepID=UPI00331F50FE